MIPCAHRARKMCVNTRKRHHPGRWLLIRKEGCFTFLLGTSQKENLTNRKGYKSNIILNLRPSQMPLFPLLITPFWLLASYNTSKRTAGLLLVICSWPKVLCVHALVAFSLVLLRLIWLTHEVLCILHFLTEQTNWNTVLCISLQHHRSVPEPHSSKLIECRVRDATHQGEMQLNGGQAWWVVFLFKSSLETQLHSL